MQVLETIDLRDWSEPVEPSVGQRGADALESGKVLFFPHLAFRLEDEERGFLSSDLASANRKNVTFDPSTGTCHGITLDRDAQWQFDKFIGRFASSANELMRNLVPSYGDRLVCARTTFRPVEIAGRSYAPKKDDRLLHVDAFPTRPTQGRRILRLFTNINPEGKNRVWGVGEEFEHFAKAFLPRLSKPSALSAWLLNACHITKGKRSPYDQLMMQLHDHCKLDATYQQTAPRQQLEFPSGSTWACFTDSVLHSALAGQYVLEQTFNLDVDGMVDSRRAPIRILERLTAMPLR